LNVSESEQLTAKKELANLELQGRHRQHVGMINRETDLLQLQIAQLQVSEENEGKAPMPKSTSSDRDR